MSRTQLALILFAVLVVLVGGFYFGCARQDRQEETGLAKGCPDGNPPSNGAQLSNCLNNLEFDVVPGAGDEQRLMINPPCPPGPCRHGPLAVIQPEKKSHKHDDGDLQEGRIIAKLFLRPGETQSYPKLGLAPGRVTYWWVQKNSNTGGRSVYLQSDTLHNSLVIAKDTTFELDSHPNYEFKQGLARFAWSDDDEKAWGTCKIDGCCR